MWQKLTIDWPCALGDWLWAVLVIAPARFLDRLTWRSALRLTARLVLAYILVRLAMECMEIGFFDVGFLFTLDAAFYWEAGAMLMLLTARSLPRQMLGLASRFLARTVRTRLLRFARRPVRHIPDRGEDEGGLAWTFAGARALA